tara:strand:- start:20 stop:451 length:432 start_codon:yes stop_codon:yes gene_type:complete
MKITKRQLKRIIRTRLHEALTTNEWSADWANAEQEIFISAGKHYGWNMEAIDGEITDDVGSGNIAVEYKRDALRLVMEFEYEYHPQSNAGTWDYTLLGGSDGPIGGTIESQGWDGDLHFIFHNIDQAQSFNSDKFKELMDDIR